MAKITAYQIATVGATYVDVNSNFTQNNYPDLLPDILAIHNSLYNLFNCGVGNRGRIFEPTYGANWLSYLQEPFGTVTANNMWIDMVAAIAKWEPRIQLINSECAVVPDASIPGYKIYISAVTPLASQKLSINFTASNT